MVGKRTDVLSFLKSQEQDWIAGLLVALIAIPLSIGIAVASHAPPYMAFLGVLIGAWVVAPRGGTDLMISGPAAGLALVLAQGRADLGSWPAFSMAVVIAGVIQYSVGRLGLGRYGHAFPMPVIKGMLSAIGFHLILKQIPHGLGWNPDFEGNLSFFEFNQSGVSNTFVDIYEAILHPQPGALLIFGLSGAALWVFARKSFTGGVLASASTGFVVHELLEKWGTGAWISKDHSTLQLTPPNLSQLLNLPDWSALLRREAWLVALMIAMISSFETLLCAEAIESLDSRKRAIDNNKELRAQGLGNFIAGLVGALPVTGLFIRSSANIAGGAVSRYAAIWQGVFVAAALLALQLGINEVPLASLAPVLILLGYRLTSLKMFVENWKIGWERFLPLAVTSLGVLFLDVLWGVFIGTLVSFFFVLRTQYRSAITVVSDGAHILIRFSKDATFINKIRLKEEFSKIKHGSDLVIDGIGATWIDSDIYDVIEEFKANSAQRGIRVQTRHLEGKRWKVTNASF